MCTAMTYGMRDWERITEDWEIKTWLTYPGTNEPVDKPALTLTLGTPAMTWDEATEEVMAKWADAWERLADL